MVTEQELTEAHKIFYDGYPSHTATLELLEKNLKAAKKVSEYYETTMSVNGNVIAYPFLAGEWGMNVWRIEEAIKEFKKNPTNNSL